MLKFSIFAKKNFEIILLEIKNIIDLGTMSFTGKYKGATHSICNLKYSLPRELSIVFHNGPNYDYNFVLEDLAEKFEG